MSQATSGATDAVYYPGDQVLFKEKDKSKWSGPAQVTNVLGNKIRMIFDGFERTVPSIDVAHFKEKKSVVRTNQINDDHEKRTKTLKENDVEDWKHEEDLPAGWQENNVEDWKHDEDIPAGWQLENQKNIRPKLHDQIEFTVKGCLRTGKVKRVGKSNGKDKNRCWVQEEDKENSYDFLQEVEHWRKVGNKVTFDGGSEENQSTAMKDNEDVGVFHLKIWDDFHGLEVDKFPAQGMDCQDYVNNTFSAELPKKCHCHLKITQAKEEEIRRWKEYGTVEQVARTMEMQIISSRWVVTEKSPQEFKARLVVKGFEEEVYPHSDSPTASRESFKTFLALAAIQIFHIKNMDVKSAFLQGTPLDREVYMEPQWELKKPGIVEVEENCVRSIRCLSQLVLLIHCIYFLSYLPSFSQSPPQG